MTKFKLTAVQQHQVETARATAAQVLNELKRQKLSGDALDMMKALEDAVSGLEVVGMAARQNS